MDVVVAPVGLPGMVATLHVLNSAQAAPLSDVSLCFASAECCHFANTTYYTCMCYSSNDVALYQFQVYIMQIGLPVLTWCQAFSRVLRRL